MRDSMKITVPYQFWHFLLVHLCAAGVAFVFQSVAFWYFLDKPIWKEVLSIVFILVYFGMMYTCAKKYAVQDCKSYTPLKPSMIKAFLLGCFVSVWTLAVYLIFKASWAVFAVDGAVTNLVGLVINFVFMYWTFPFYGIMNISAETITWYSEILIFAVPVLAAVLGYFAGCKNINIVESIDKFAYEKESDDD